MTNRRYAALILIALGVVALAVTIGRRAVVDGPRGERMATPISNRGTAGAGSREIIASPSSAHVSARELPRLPAETKFAIPTESSPKELPTIQLDMEKAEESRQAFWKRLRAFAVEADLSESQWERLLGDLSDVASSRLEALKPGLRVGFEPKVSVDDVLAAYSDAASLDDGLAHDLDERIASWMTERQLDLYQLRLHGSDYLIGKMWRLRMMGLLVSRSRTAVVSDARR